MLDLEVASGSDPIAGSFEDRAGQFAGLCMETAYAKLAGALLGRREQSIRQAAPRMIGMTKELVAVAVSFDQHEGDGSIPIVRRDEHEVSFDPPLAQKARTRMTRSPGTHLLV